MKHNYGPAPERRTYYGPQDHRPDVTVRHKDHGGPLEIIASLEFAFTDDDHARRVADAWRTTATEGYGASGPQFREDCIRIAEAIETYLDGKPQMSTANARRLARLKDR